MAYAQTEKITTAAHHTETCVDFRGRMKTLNFMHEQKKSIDIRNETSDHYQRHSMANEVKLVFLDYRTKTKPVKVGRSRAE